MSRHGPREVPVTDLQLGTIGGMEDRPLGFTLPLLLAGICAAQQPAGLLTGMPPAGVQVTTLGTGVESELIARIPADAYRGIGTYVPPASHRLRGAVILLRDTSLGDGERFSVHVYLENGTTNLPTINGGDAPGTTAIFSAIDLQTPAGTANHDVQVLFGNGIDVPIGSDLFISVVYHTPGLVIRTVGGSSVPGFVTSLFDACGAGLNTNEAFAFSHTGGGTQFGTMTSLGSSTIGWQPMIELLVDGSSGVAVASRGPGQAPTASFYSGLHPDSASPSNQPSRHDVPGYVFRSNGTIGEGSPVFLLGSTQPFAFQPWIVLSPGNAILHLSPINLVGLGLSFVNQEGIAQILWNVPNSPAVRGLEVRTQAFGFDPVTGYAASGAAARQRF